MNIEETKNFFKEVLNYKDLENNIDFELSAEDYIKQQNIYVINANLIFEDSVIGNFILDYNFDKNYLKITQVYIQDNYQRLGISKNYINHLIVTCKKHDVKFLVITTADKSIYYFFENTGWNTGNNDLGLPEETLIYTV